MGDRIDRLRDEGKLAKVISLGPRQAQMLSPIDTGLTTRTDLAGKWISGIYWEQTSHVTNHHAADCLHCVVNIGGIPPNSERVVRGKIYWFKGSKADLLKRWSRDFGHQ